MNSTLSTFNSGRFTAFASAPPSVEIISRRLNKKLEYFFGCCLIGMVNPTSQKAYWSIADRLDSPIASTGIYNLTEDQTPINVHFADGSDQTWSMVRLQQEEQHISEATQETKR